MVLVDKSSYINFRRVSEFLCSHHIDTHTMTDYDPLYLRDRNFMWDKYRRSSLMLSEQPLDSDVQYPDFPLIPNSLRLAFGIAVLYIQRVDNNKDVNTIHLFMRGKPGDGKAAFASNMPTQDTGFDDYDEEEPTEVASEPVMANYDNIAALDEG